MFRGREVTHPERGTMILDRLAEELAELSVVEQRPTQDGRNMTMMLGPSKAVLAGRADGHEEAASTEESASMEQAASSDGASPDGALPAQSVAPEGAVAGTEPGLP
jgi:translation initiation factor IF-3